MNPEIEEQIRRRDEAWEIYDAEVSRLNDLRAACSHNIVSSEADGEYPEDGDRICTKCGADLGYWFCPKNPPTHACEYTRDSGEWCVHCGNPEERK